MPSKRPSSREKISSKIKMLQIKEENLVTDHTIHAVMATWQDLEIESIKTMNLKHQEEVKQTSLANVLAAAPGVPVGSTNEEITTTNTSTNTTTKTMKPSRTRSSTLKVLTPAHQDTEVA